MSTNVKNTYPEPKEALYRIQRALAGHVSYLAACETNKTFSEYILYEPILRILMMRGFSVQCEYICPGIAKRGRRGDYKKLDFEANRRRVRFAMEVKWPRDGKRVLDARKDHKKLVAFKRRYTSAQTFLCLFGRYDHLKRIEIVPNQFVEYLDPIYALFRRTQFGCRIFELKTPNIRLSSYGSSVTPPTGQVARRPPAG